MAFIAVDIGNTNTKIALVEGEIKGIIRFNNYLSQAPDDCISMLRKEFGDPGYEGGIIASVVSSRTAIFHDLISRLTGVQPIVLDHTTDTGLEIRLESPETLGADRIANAVAAYKITGGKTVVVDFGSATTTTGVNEKGEIFCGTIMPGVDMMFQVLSEKTDRLPLLSLNGSIKGIGRDTKSSIISGIAYGTAGAVERILREIEREMGRFETVITGGASYMIRDLLGVRHRHVRDLTIMGLKIIFERNRYESVKT